MCSANDLRSGALEMGFSTMTMFLHTPLCAGIAGRKWKDHCLTPSLLPRSGTLQLFSFSRTQVGTKGKFDDSITIKK
jgi:hypothetical protein